MSELFEPAEWAWLRLRVRLRNQRNTVAKQHPLFVLRGLLYSVRGTLAKEDLVDFTFRVANATGARVRLGGEYALDILFNDGAERQAERFGEALRVWTMDPEHNFKCVSVGPVEGRNLDILRVERPLDMSAGEVCLDFHTPLSFSPADKAKPSMILMLQLAEMLERRFSKLSGKTCQLPVMDLGLLNHFQGPFESHQHRKSEKEQEFLSGVCGPLYLRGEWQAWEPWLRLASEWMIGSGTTKGQGAFRLATQRPYFDLVLGQTEIYHNAWEAYAAETDHDENFTHVMRDAADLGGEIAREVADGTWEARPARMFAIHKPSGGSRSICLLDPRDALVHRVLHGVLAPVLDRVMDDASNGFRPGRSVASARKSVIAALHDGMDHVVESDLADFFDSIPWDRMQVAWESVLPESDRHTRKLLHRVLRTPVEWQAGQATSPKRGLLQGSPLSPLLANLYLLPFDAALRKAGFRLVRYADDFVVLTRGREQAEAALALIQREAEALGLTLKGDKTALRAASLGFRFLGHDLGGDFEDAVIERTALRRAVVFRNPYAFVGLDHGAVILKKDRHVLAHIPLERIGQLIFHGSFTLSTVLLSVCAKRGIPVTLCSPVGHHLHTYVPLSRAFHETLGRHAAAFHRLSKRAKLAVAVSAVHAKIRHHAAWLSDLPDAAARKAAKAILKEAGHLPSATSVESLRGMEGNAARTAFRAVNDLLHVPEFKSEHRLPHDKPDRWNALLDFGYSQLFSHLNALVRTEGLNPFLGFLHSPGDHFESLVADLQEPFRPRIDRWAVRAVNLATALPDDFEVSADAARWTLRREAFPKLIENFARELDRRLMPDRGTLHQLIHAQVLVLRAWVDQGDELHFWSPENPSET